MLKVLIPNNCQNEQSYALDVLLGDFLGLAFEVQTYHGDVIEITSPDYDGKLTLDVSFFYKANQAWLKRESMPALPLANWTPAEDGIEANLIESCVPVLYGKPGLVKNENHIHCNLDIFGSAFFMLSRYEELITKDRDNHDRFPATASVAYKAAFLERPLVDEYVEILWACIHAMWPDLLRKDRHPYTYVTCDVDLPFQPHLYSFKSLIWHVLRALIKERKIIKPFKYILSYLQNQLYGDYIDENYSALQWIVDVNEKYDHKLGFYFIPYKTSRLDSELSILSSRLSSFLKKINKKHNCYIGIHPGYNTYNNSENFINSVSSFKTFMENNNISLSEIGGRQHYLRYNVDETPVLWEQAGLSFDSSLGFADRSGFRCGTSQAFAMYSIRLSKKLKLIQKPLIVMESTVISERYENLGYSKEAYEKILMLKNRCYKYGGCFCFLWHEYHLVSSKDREFFKAIID